MDFLTNTLTITTNMNQEIPRRRWYDVEDCNFTEATDLRLDYRFSKIEEKVDDLEARQLTSEQMLKEIHEKICKTSNIITGFKLGAGSVIAVIAIALSVVGGFFTGKISITEIFKMLF